MNSYGLRNCYFNFTFDNYCDAHGKQNAANSTAMQNSNLDFEYVQPIS